MSTATIRIDHATRESTLEPETAFRTARTRQGTLVPLHRLIPVEGGWTSYVLHRNGHAVAVFTPR
jgi:hypothetical protein